MKRVIGIGETVLDILFKNDQPQKDVPGGSTFNSKVSLGRAGVNCAMMTVLIVSLVSIMVFGSCGTKQEVVEIPKPIQGGEYVPEHSETVFLVMYDAEVGKTPLQKAIEKYGCEIVYDYNIITGMALKKPKDKTLEETMEYFRKVEGVTSVEYDHIYRLTDPVKPKLEIR